MAKIIERREHQPKMEYEGDRNDTANLQCVWKIDGVEVFRHPYSYIQIYAHMIDCHFKVRLAILQWAEMLVNPD